MGSLPPSLSLFEFLPFCRNRSPQDGPERESYVVLPPSCLILLYKELLTSILSRILTARCLGTTGLVQQQCTTEITTEFPPQEW